MLGLVKAGSSSINALTKQMQKLELKDGLKAAPPKRFSGEQEQVQPFII
jgi:hypothetical protein